MPTPGERRALLFIASVAALGVAVRGWSVIHPQNPAALAGDRTALARQIETVDSAIATTSSARAPRPVRTPRPQAPRTDAVPRAPRAPAPRSAAVPRASSSRVRQPAPADTQPRDPRQAYWDRSLYFDSVRLALESSEEHRPIRARPTLPSALRRHAVCGGAAAARSRRRRHRRNRHDPAHRPGPRPPHRGGPDRERPVRLHHRLGAGPGDHRGPRKTTRTIRDLFPFSTSWRCGREAGSGEKISATRGVRCVPDTAHLSALFRRTRVRSPCLIRMAAGPLSSHERTRRRALTRHGFPCCLQGERTHW